MVCLALLSVDNRLFWFRPPIGRSRTLQEQRRCQDAHARILNEISHPPQIVGAWRGQGGTPAPSARAAAPTAAVRPQTAMPSRPRSLATKAYASAALRVRQT